MDLVLPGTLGILVHRVSLAMAAADPRNYISKLCHLVTQKIGIPLASALLHAAHYLPSINIYSGHEGIPCSVLTYPSVGSVCPSKFCTLSHPDAVVYGHVRPRESAVR